MNYQPPYTITARILNLVASICEAIGRLTAVKDQAKVLRLRRINRVRSIQGSLAIEGNTLSEAQITAILQGKRVIAPPREVQEVKNAIEAYDRFAIWKPEVEKDFLEAHQLLMSGLINDAGAYRNGGVGVMSGSQVIHMAPPADRVPFLMNNLLEWLQFSDDHPLITSSVFHYEFEFIHPFADGNGRLGRLWQSLILAQWNQLFAEIAVESLIHERQSDYYRAIQESTRQNDSEPFIAFILQAIMDTINDSAPPSHPSSHPSSRKSVEGSKRRNGTRTASGHSAADRPEIFS